MPRHNRHAQILNSYTTLRTFTLTPDRASICVTLFLFRLRHAM
jgi:hypothetical protein